MSNTSFSLIDNNLLYYLFIAAIFEMTTTKQLGRI